MKIKIKCYPVGRYELNILNIRCLSRRGRSSELLPRSPLSLKEKTTLNRTAILRLTSASVRPQRLAATAAANVSASVVDP